MPRGGRSRGRSMSPVRSAPPRTFARAPAPAPVQRAPVPTQQQPTAMAPAGAQRQGPGLMGQMAATAGGVAIGSAVGHTIGHAMTGGMGGGGQPAQQEQLPAMQQQQPQYAQYDQPQQGGTCAYELQQFMNCAQNTSDITFCHEFNESLKQCKKAYGMQ